LEAGGEVGFLLFGEFGGEVGGRSVEADACELLGGAENGGFEAGERKVVGVFELRDGERNGRLPCPSRFGDGRAAGVWKAEDFGDFVEGFANGVVAGLAKDFVIFVGVHEDEASVAARNDESEEGELVVVLLAKLGGVDVGENVVDGVESSIVSDGEGAGGEGADHEGADEAGMGGDGDSVNVGPADGFDGLVYDGIDGFDVGAGGDFGDDSAGGGVDVDLGDDDVGQDFAAVFDDCGCGFVAGGFDAEDVH